MRAPKCRAMAQSTAGLSPRRPGFDIGPIPVRLVVDKVVLRQVFSSEYLVFACKYNSTNTPYSSSSNTNLMRTSGETTNTEMLFRISGNHWTRTAFILCFEASKGYCRTPRHYRVRLCLLAQTKCCNGFWQTRSIPLTSLSPCHSVP